MIFSSEMLRFDKLLSIRLASGVPMLVLGARAFNALSFKVIMSKILVLCIAGILLTGCTNQEFRAYLMNKKIEKREKRERKNIYAYVPDLSYEDVRVALLVKDEQPRSEDAEPIPDIAPDFVLRDDIIENYRKDMATFYVTARSLRLQEKYDELDMLAEGTLEYLFNRIDPLLAKWSLSRSHEVNKVVTELQLMKAHLLYEIQDIDSACQVISDIELKADRQSLEQLRISSERFDIDEERYIILADFSYMCRQ